MSLTKRPHKKSRAGCLGCKTRKIKCDEVRPQCTFCITHELSCIYLSRPVALTQKAQSRAQSPASFSTEDSHVGFAQLSRCPSQFLPSYSTNQVDLRLMHHYSTITCASFDSIRRDKTIDVWQMEIPRLAFEHEFLMDSLLGTASLHMHRLNPGATDFPQQVAVYEHRAVQGFRVAASRISPSNYEAVLATSLLLLILSSGHHDTETEGGLWINNWLGLLLGMLSILRAVRWEALAQSPLWPLLSIDFDLYSVTPVPPVFLEELCASLDAEEEQDKSNFETFRLTSECLGLLYARLNSISPRNELNVEIMAWPSKVPQAFILLAKNMQPQALIILAHYLVFFELNSGFWWTDIASREILAISKALDSRWQRFLDIPLQAVQMQGRQSIVELLLGQLPIETSNEVDFSYSAATTFTSD